MLEVSSSAFASRPPIVWVNARCHGGFTARASQQLRGSGSSFAHSTSIFVATDFIRVAILWRKALKERPAMGSDTRMNKCFVRNTVPNRAGSRKKTRRAHVPRGQLSPTLQLETMSLPSSNVRLPVAGPPAAFHKCPSHHSKLWHGTATIPPPGDHRPCASSLRS